MEFFELSNNQRKYFGVIPTIESWDKVSLSNSLIAYFDKEKIVKIIDYSWGYFEYDTDIDTINRKILIPKTSRGKEQKLTIPKLLKIKGLGVGFSISFTGGAIGVWDNKRNLMFINSYFEEGSINNFEDATKWINNYIEKSPTDYFIWLKNQLNKKKEIHKVKVGDIVAFKIAREEYGFARVIRGELKTKGANYLSNSGNLIHPRSLIVATYAFVSRTLVIDIDELITKQTLPTFFVFDYDISNGQMPIIANRPLTERELNLPKPTSDSTQLMITQKKTDILNFISTL